VTAALRRALLAAALAAAPAGAAAAGRLQDAGAKELVPPARTEYLGRRIAPTMSFEGGPWLMRATREKEERCEALLQALRLAPGQTVADVGCGNGFYTFRLAALVGPRGKVYAVDIQPEMLAMLAEEAKRRGGAENVESVLGSLVDPRLPEGSLDLAFLVDVYHEFSHPEQMLRALRKALKPGGRIVLVEFRLEDPEVPIKLLHKMSKAQIRKELAANDFELDEEFDELPWQHVMFFRPRRAAPPDERGPTPPAGDR